MNNNLPTIHGYVRVSSDDQAKNGFSQQRRSRRVLSARPSVSQRSRHVHDGCRMERFEHYCAHDESWLRHQHKSRQAAH